jgi:hypothetical protein
MYFSLAIFAYPVDLRMEIIHRHLLSCIPVEMFYTNEQDPR